MIDYEGAWVKTKGYNIPENAFVAGEQRGQPLYVGRGRHGGSITPGRVSFKVCSCTVTVKIDSNISFSD